jgi:hypothetical protein
MSALLMGIGGGRGLGDADAAGVTTQDFLAILLLQAQNNNNAAANWQN